MNNIAMGNGGNPATGFASPPAPGVVTPLGGGQLAGTTPTIQGIVNIDAQGNKSPIVLVTAREKYGKCLEGSTLLQLADGRRKPIAEIVREKLAEPILVATMGGITAIAPTRFAANGKEPIFELRTRLGHTIKATAGHPFMTLEGRWQRLSAFHPGDRIMVAGSTKAASASEFRPARTAERAHAVTKLLAYLIADGSLGSVCPVFTKNEDEVREDFIDAVTTVGDQYTEGERDENHSWHVTVKSGEKVKSFTKNLLVEHGLDGKLSGDKFVPEAVFSYAPALIRTFLNRLFTCDGCIDAYGHVSYSSKSRRLVEDVAQLVLRFGIYCKIRTKFIDGEVYGAELQISARDEVIRFIDEIGFFGEKARKAKALRPEIASLISNQTQFQRYGDLIADRIESIEPAGEAEVFDIEIPEHHNFIANNFVVHNSSLATTLFGWPEPHMQPLILAWDRSGPDACVARGFSPHAIKIAEMQGDTALAKGRAALTILERNVQQVRQQYGAIVVDCVSTMSAKFLDEATRFSKNPDPRSYYADMMKYGIEFLNRVSDLGLPVVWLTWLEESEMVDAGDKRKKLIMGGPSVPGKKWRAWVGGRPDQMLLLDKERHGVGSPGADADGYVRVLHTKSWNNVNVEGRYSHVVPEPAPANLAYVLACITGRGFGR